MPHAFIAAVDLGASNLRVAIANEDGEIEARRHAPLPPGSPEPVLERVGRTIDDLVRGVWVGASVAAIGVVLPGMVDPSAGTVASIANMPGWDNVPIARLLGTSRGVPVAIENDANAAAIGEGWLGTAKGLREFVFIALGTGIGAGVVLDGRIHRGAHYLAGEVAFFPMTGEQLRAGDWQHCLEGSVGGRAMDHRAADLLGERATAAELFAAARAGQPAAAAWLAETQEYVAMAVAQIAALLDPEAIVFGGGVAIAQGEAFLASVRNLALPCTPGTPRILLSSLGEDAQILGAVRLALDRLRAL
ncbi:MAG TPA: ROK family protein [Steroidobacteraceae bacterium]|nr:ROK family protein [Steroidobacteraceae bacterium]